MKKLTDEDWFTINEGLALLEADIEGQEPDEYAEPEETEEWRREWERVSHTRAKVHERLEGKWGA